MGSRGGIFGVLDHVDPELEKPERQRCRSPRLSHNTTMDGTSPIARLTKLKDPQVQLIYG